MNLPSFLWQLADVYITFELSFKINSRINLTVSPWEGLPTKREPRRFTAPDPAVAFLDGSTSQ